MAERFCTDTGEAVYRSRDAVKNFKIRYVGTWGEREIERLIDSFIHSFQESINSCAHFNFHFHTVDEEELVVGWQDKFFSQYEMDLYQNESVCQTPLEKQYHTEILAMEKAKRRRNQRIFTYTDFDRFTNWEEQAQSLMTSAQVRPTFLAERMANIRHRRQERRPMDSNITKTRLVVWEPSKEFKNSHIVNTSMQSMHIMADLGPAGKLGLKENEYVLCTIRADSSGVITLKPDFNNDGESYRLGTEGDKREVWHIYLENASAPICTEEKEREQRMYRDLYNRHKDYLNSLVVQRTHIPCLYFPVSAQGYEYDNLYVHFFLELPNSWSTASFQSLSGVTQTCRTRTFGKDNVAFFSYPFSFESFFRKEDESEGELVVTCPTWRPLQTGTVAELRRFFIGGAPELEDISDVRIPSTFKGDRLSRFGFRTQATGSITFVLNCLQHARAFVDSKTLKKRRQTVLDQLGGHSELGSVSNVLEAFHRARKRMQDARESLPQDLINTNASFISESSA
uniref:MKS transition zone complex subunit 1 n=1 Tax=Electrophorus electricus TaxID=8005 RepID=A0A4W4H076_ELEEL